MTMGIHALLAMATLAAAEGVQMRGTGAKHVAQPGVTRLGRRHPVNASGQHTNPARKERRDLVKAIGRRQAIKAIKADRAMARHVDLA